MIALLVLSASFANAEGQKRYAKPGDGFAVNQPFVALDDGTYFAVHDRKIIPAEKIRTPDGVNKAKRRARYNLDRQRYWAGGEPGKDTALERFVKEQEAKKRAKVKRQMLRAELQFENWLQGAIREHLLKSDAPEPKKEGG